MKYIKLFEAKTKQNLKDFCEMYLAYLLDDDTFKLQIKEGQSHIINDGIYWHNALKVTQSIKVRNSPRFDTIILTRESIKRQISRAYDYDAGEYRNYEYDDRKSITFNWDKIKDHFIPFFTILDRRYRVVNLTFTDGRNIKGVKKEDIERDIPFPIKEIYLTVRK